MMWIVMIIVMIITNNNYIDYDNVDKIMIMIIMDNKNSLKKEL